jgi:hypothetical protein
MPAGRSQVAYDGIREDSISMKIDNSTIVYDSTKANGAATTMIGKAVVLSADDTVALCADGDAVFGKLLKVEADNFATIQRWGMADLPAGASAATTRGNRIVGALGAASAKGYIRDAAAATAAELVKARGVIVNVADTTHVWVDLG